MRASKIVPRECELPKLSFSPLSTLKWRRILPLVQSSSMTNHPGPNCCKVISANPRLNFNLGFLLFCSKGVSRIIFSILYSASNHCIAGKRKTEFGFKAFISVFEFRTNPGLSWPCFEQPGPGLVFTFLTPQKHTRFSDPEVKVDSHKNTLEDALLIFFVFLSKHRLRILLSKR